ncbi:hypothetical protein HPB48_000573 [Haemaphysalis longicornis]|uniref:Transposase Tc1-like domain-containing protein n=1 Tax=Haemaphysalis longicornis TaxID=44386 RepID=A0A9J6G9J9_HAELO|nr:hypothetical protein HPB48_000573 [Haemaphysalis longicornis]
MAPRLTLPERKAIALMGRTMSQRDISVATGRPVPTVNRIVQAFTKEGRLADAPRFRPPRATTHEEDRLIVATAVDNPFLSAREIRDMLGLDISAQLIRSRLHEADIKGRMAAQKTQLEAKHRDQRMEFEDWAADNWRAVVFSDEAAFCTCWDQHKWVWRPDKCK